MPYCPKCGVEVESKKCPLCSYEIKRDLHTKPFSHDIINNKKKLNLSQKDKYNIFNVSACFLCLIIASVNITIDYLINSDMTWSVFPLIVVFTAALITTAATQIRGILKVGLILLFVLMMLLAIDLFIKEVHFFLSISLPVICIISILAFGVVFISKKSRKRGANVAGYIILATSLFTVSLDIIIQRFLNQNIKITWSLITSVSLIPIALFLMYIHYSVSKKVDLDKVFHT